MKIQLTKQKFQLTVNGHSKHLQISLFFTQNSPTVYRILHQAENGTLTLYGLRSQDYATIEKIEGTWTHIEKNVSTPVSTLCFLSISPVWGALVLPDGFLITEAGETLIVEEITPSGDEFYVLYVNSPSQEASEVGRLQPQDVEILLAEFDKKEREIFTDYELLDTKIYKTDIGRMIAA